MITTSAQVKFDFYNTATVASVANVILKNQNMTIKKELEVISAPFQRKALSGAIINNIDGIRVRANLNFQHTLEPDKVDDLLAHIVTYIYNVNVQIRFYPFWATDTANYLIVKLDSPIQNATNWAMQVRSSSNPSIDLIERLPVQSIPTWLKNA